MKNLLTLSLLLLAGCGPVPEESATSYATRLQGRLQDEINRASIVCRDGVQYLAGMTHGSYGTFAPHLHQDGKPYLCSVKPATYSEVPVNG